MNKFAPRLEVLPPSQRDLWLLQSGLSLEDGLRFAKRVYGEHFNTLLPLQALCYFEEPSLRTLPAGIRSDLLKAVRSVR